MDRGIPEYNRVLNKKWLDYNKKLHKQSIYQVKPTVDNAMPDSLRYPLIKTKREMIIEERCTEIERANRILLEKMATIMSSQPINKASIQNFKNEVGNIATQNQINNNIQTTKRINQANPIQLGLLNDLIAPINNRSKSLNRTVRQKEVDRIQLENSDMLKRLQDQKSNYNAHLWKQDRKQKVKMIKQICYYPPTLLKKSSKLRNKRRNIMSGGGLYSDHNPNETIYQMYQQQINGPMNDQFQDKNLIENNTEIYDEDDIRRQLGINQEQDQQQQQIYQSNKFKANMTISPDKQNQLGRDIQPQQFNQRKRASLQQQDTSNFVNSQHQLNANTNNQLINETQLKMTQSTIIQANQQNLNLVSPMKVQQNDSETYGDINFNQTLLDLNSSQPLNNQSQLIIDNLNQTQPLPFNNNNIFINNNPNQVLSHATRLIASKRPPPMPIGYNDYGIDQSRQVLYRNFHEVDRQIFLVEISRDPKKVFVILFPNYEKPQHEHQIVVMAEKQAIKLMNENNNVFEEFVKRFYFHFGKFQIEGFHTKSGISLHQKQINYKFQLECEPRETKSKYKGKIQRVERVLNQQQSLEESALAGWIVSNELSPVLSS
eukprot:403361935